ncbi:sensor histidine kinase [Methylopila sp. M107]|uniref:sensor histidine kinase n=1 Tax=Methylopila sp. M107 TaxID=1101190 RepID=UPI00036AA688|nr:sensor histidine kinase [Methylopila sp. M107]
MTDSSDPSTPSSIEELAATPELAEALASDRFKQFLDHMPIAIAVGESDRGGAERIVYVNHEAELILTTAASDLEGAEWSALDGKVRSAEGRAIGEALIGDDPPNGVFEVVSNEGPNRLIEIQSATVSDEKESSRFRLVALIDVTERDAPQREAFEAQLRDKDVLLREIQHRVKNNLQIITALIRMEARRAGTQIGTGPFERLAGRIEALGLLYRQLAAQDRGSEEVDLGAYLSQIGAETLKGQASEGVRLDSQVEAIETRLEVAMPVGLLVNELLTNSLKYAFQGRNEGVLTLKCLKEGDGECVVTVADDGVGMAAGASWPQPGKLGALMVRSLEDSTGGKVEVTAPGEGGVSTTIRFPLRAGAARR